MLVLKLMGAHPLQCCSMVDVSIYSVDKIRLAAQSGSIPELAGCFYGGLHHVEIYVSNLQRSTGCWSWFLLELGFEPFQEWKERRSWKLDDTYLVFVQAEEKHLSIPYNRSHVGLNHLAFHADSRNQVDELTQEIRARGMKVLYEDRHPFAGGEDHYAVYFEDPDRIKVELIAP